MLDNLLVEIERIQSRLVKYRNELQENEIRTRVALIDPLLRSLGWEVSDPAIVTTEYKIQGYFADYALKGPDGRIAAIVEAKKLGTPLVNHQAQMLNYANIEGISYAALTDGNQWVLYSVFEPVALSDRKLMVTIQVRNMASSQ